MASKNTRLQCAAFSGGYFPISIDGTGTATTAGGSGYKWVGLLGSGGTSGFGGGVVRYTIAGGVVGQRIHAVQTYASSAAFFNSVTLGGGQNFISGYDQHVALYSSNRDVTTAADIEAQHRVGSFAAQGDAMVDIELPSGHQYLYCIFYSLGHVGESTSVFTAGFYNKTLPMVYAGCNVLIEEP